MKKSYSCWFAFSVDDTANGDGGGTLVYYGHASWHFLNRSARRHTNNDVWPRNSVGYGVERYLWDSEVLYPLWKGIASRELIGKVLIAFL